MGKYHDELNRSRLSMSPEQISAAKTSKKKARGQYRKEENIKRMTETVKLTPEAQLQALDFRLGKGVGAKKERKRLLLRISNKSKTNPKKEEGRVRGKQANSVVVDEVVEKIEVVEVIEDKGPKIMKPIIPWSELKKGLGR